MVDRTYEAWEKGVHSPAGSGDGPNLYQAILLKERNQTYESIFGISDSVLPRM